MRRKSIATVAALAAALVIWYPAVGSPPGETAENGPVEDSRLAQLHIRLLGVSQ